MELQEIATIGETSGMSVLSSVAQIREKIKSLGRRPDPGEVEEARKGLIAADSALAQALEAIVFEAAPSGVDVLKWAELQAEKENAARSAAEREKISLRATLQLDELHQLYENMLKEAESVLEKKSSSAAAAEAPESHAQEQNVAVGRAMDEALEKLSLELNLSNQMLQQVPESIGKISSLTVLNLAVNRIQVLPDAIAGLVNLQRLDVHSNHLRVLPDSIGLLKKLQFLDVSSNELRKFPESINGCSSLIEINADFNKLDCLPSNFGRGLDCLERLSLHLNNLTYLPASLCEVISLKHLDVHFNKLRSLPKAIGNLSNLETLDASSNFSDLVWLPDSVGDLVALKYLDLSYNQIKELPLSLGRLRSNLKTLKLDENPLVDPPLEVVREGSEETLRYLADRWEASLTRAEEEFLHQETINSDVGVAAQGKWIGGWVSGVYSSVSSYLGSPKGSLNRDDYLEQQL